MHVVAQLHVLRAVQALQRAEEVGAALLLAGLAHALRTEVRGEGVPGRSGSSAS